MFLIPQRVEFLAHELNNYVEWIKDWNKKISSKAENLSFGQESDLVSNDWGQIIEEEIAW